tara:strand:- start:25 stop:162 length:138 start_codon:yes stop_codon:yes gene_type:complete
LKEVKGLIFLDFFYFHFETAETAIETAETARYRAIWQKKGIFSLI